MKISTKGRYGIRIMLDVAKHSAGGPVKIADVSARQEISLKYVEQIMGMLSRGGLLRSLRGAQGGYTLVKSPSEYTAGEILRFTEGDIEPVECVSNPSLCPRAGGCAARSFWEGLNKKVYEYIDGVTLQDLIDSEGNSSDFYQI